MPQNTSQNPEGRQRQADEKADVISMQLAAKTGIEKRLYFYNELARMANGVIFAAQQGMEQAAMAWAGLNAMQQQKEQSWGTRGGLAAGITGSAVVGAAVAADTMRKNAEIRAQNAAISRKNLDATSPLFDDALRGKADAEALLAGVRKAMESARQLRTEERPIEELMEGVELGAPEMAVTAGGTVVFRMPARPRKSFQIHGTAAVIDGSFAVEVYEGERKIGEAYLNLPRDGLTGDAMLESVCLAAKPGGTYTVVVLPLGLWLIQRAAAAPVTYSAGVGVGRRKETCPIPDLDDLMPPPTLRTAWKPAAVLPVPWQQRRPLRERELAERKASLLSERQKEKNRKKKLPERVLGALLLAAGLIMLAGGAVPNVMREGFTPRVSLLLLWTAALSLAGLTAITARVDRKHHLAVPLLLLAVAILGFIGFAAMTYGG